MEDALQAYSLPKPDSLIARLKSRSQLERDYQKYRFRKHADVLALKKRMPEKLFNDYFKFAFVRNPWDRLVSEYEYIRNHPSHGRHKRVTGLATFTEFIQMQIPRRDAYQSHMLSDKNGKLLADFIGRFENLEEDWDTVSKRIGVPLAALPHINKTRHRDFRDYYAADSIELVAKHWADEIKLFDYQF